MDIKGRIIAERVFSDSSLFTFFGNSAGNYGCFGIVDSFCYYNRILSPQEIQHNFSVLNNTPSINAIETSDKTSFLLGSDTDHVMTPTGHTEEERYTALLSKFGKKFTSTGEDITVANAIENQRVLSAKISGQTVKNYVNTISYLGIMDTVNNITTSIINNIPIEINKEYTLIYNIGECIGTCDGYIYADDNIALGSSKITISQKGLLKTKFTSSTTRVLNKFQITNRSVGMKIDFRGVMLLEGDWTNKDIGYFTGLSSTQATITANNLKYSFYANAEDKTQGKVIDLGGVGDVRDTLEIKEDGSGVYTQNTKEIVLNDKPILGGVWKRHPNTTETYLKIYLQGITSYENAANSKLISDKLNLGTFNDTAYTIYLTKDKWLGLVLPKGVDGIDDTLESGLLWLSKNNPIMRYQLATPIVTHIPKELVHSILTQATNKFTFGDAIKPSGVEITVPVDKVTDLETRLSRLEKVMTSTSNLSLMANYVEDEYNDSLNQV